MAEPFETSEDALDRKLLLGLSKIALALKSRSWRGAGLRGLTPTQGQILNLLKSRAGSAFRLGELALGLGTSAATASTALAAMVRKGLVKKKISSEDGRSLAVSLTRKGEREALRVAAWPDFLLQAIAVLSLAEQSAFFRGLIKMIHVLQEKGEISSGRMCIDCKFFRPRMHADPERPHHCVFLDFPFAESEMRLECAEQVAADPEFAERNRRHWQADSEAVQVSIPF